MPARWPERLWLVRHGQSSGNVARDAAMAAGHLVIDIAERDVDVPLSALGEEQSAALGAWFASLPPSEHPTTVFASPYLRTRQSASLIRDAMESLRGKPMKIDERLREKEFGILDRLTREGIAQRFPEQAEARARVGKFYFRPPAGESWCDVILRLRSFLDTINLHHAQPGSRVLIVAHQVVVLCMRYLLEEMTEEQILAIDRERDVANCSVTEYAFDDAPDSGAPGGRLRLLRYNVVAPLEISGAPVTAAPDKPAAPR